MAQAKQIKVITSLYTAPEDDLSVNAVVDDVSTDMKTELSNLYAEYPGANKITVVVTIIKD